MYKIMNAIITIFYDSDRSWCFSGSTPGGVVMWEWGCPGNSYYLRDITLGEIAQIADSCKTLDKFETVLDERFDIWPD